MLEESACRRDFGDAVEIATKYGEGGGLSLVRNRGGRVHGK